MYLKFNQFSGLDVLLGHQVSSFLWSVDHFSLVWQSLMISVRIGQHDFVQVMLIDRIIFFGQFFQACLNLKIISPIPNAWLES